ncbi:MAG: hypothetical protein R6V12_06320, partial [Candidatus Hydrogenedentota bacterium]
MDSGSGSLVTAALDYFEAANHEPLGSPIDDENEGATCSKTLVQSRLAPSSLTWYSPAFILILSFSCSGEMSYDLTGSWSVENEMYSESHGFIQNTFEEGFVIT